MIDDPSIPHTFHHFRRIRREIIEAGDDPLAPNGEVLLRTGGVLGVGILLGGGFPGAAASVTLLLERAYPGEEWPWFSGDEA